MTWVVNLADGNFFQADAILQRLPIGDNIIKDAEPTLLITSDQV